MGRNQPKISRKTVEKQPKNSRKTLDNRTPSGAEVQHRQLKSPQLLLEPRKKSLRNSPQESHYGGECLCACLLVLLVLAAPCLAQLREEYVTQRVIPLYKFYHFNAKNIHQFNTPWHV